MINYIEFTSDKVVSEDNSNVIDNMSNYMVILCDSGETKDTLSDIFESDDMIYLNDLEGDSEIKNAYRYYPTSVYVIDGKQRIIITIEDPYVLTCTNPEDVWFAQATNDGKIEIYPITAFIGWQDRWQGGIWDVYRDVIVGRYGNFGRYDR